MQNGAIHPTGDRDAAPARDAFDAVLLAEHAIAQAIDAGAGTARVESAGLDRLNAFAQPVRVEAPIDGVHRVARAATLAEAGERVAVLTSAAELAPARAVMRDIASRRLGLVVHAIESLGSEAAFGLTDLGWGVLFAADAQESADLTLVARRAAEDSGTPFVVVHDAALASKASPLAPIDASLVDAFIGAPGSRLRPAADPSHPSHADVGPRAFAERVPFALASAFRDLEALTGRHRDALRRSPPGQGAEAMLMLVGLGRLGARLLAEVPRVRALGHDVGAVTLTAMRPFPGARAVRFLARAHAVTVLEHTDEALAQSNAVTRELKAAFVDALTWAPDYPGIGRVPRVHSGVLRSVTRELEAEDVDAIVRNMLAGDGGRRFFVLGGEPTFGLDTAEHVTRRAATMR